MLFLPIYDFYVKYFEHQGQMKVLSRNVAGLNARPKLHEALNSAKRYDIALFQETKLTISNKALVRLK